MAMHQGLCSHGVRTSCSVILSVRDSGIVDKNRKKRGSLDPGTAAA
jgi:hypothetical protein